MFYSDSKTLQSFQRARSAIFPLALLVLSVLVVKPEAVGQTPSDTGKAKETKTTTTTRPRHRPRPRPVTPDASKTPASVLSNDFLELGYRFHDKEKWNAAEAAYKEATTVWSANGPAWLALGYLYLDLKNVDPKKQLEQARAVHNKLRSVDSSFASQLLAAINDFQEARVAR